MMGEEAMPEGSSLRKVYGYSPGRAYLRGAWVGMGFGVLLAFLYGFLGCTDYFQNVWIVLVAAFWLLAACSQAAILYLQPRVRLVTSPEGIELFEPGYSVSTTWDNIEKVRVRKWFRSPGFEVLYLRQKPALHSSSPLRWLWWPTLSLGSLKLPLGLFQRLWQGELGQDFRRYAPHLFSAEERERPQTASSSQSTSVQSKPKGAWIAGGVLATLALLVGLLVFCRSRLHSFDYYIAWGDRYAYSFNKGDQTQAIEAYTHAIELDPQNAGAYLNRGNLYYDQGDYEAALADFERGVELDPDSAWAYYYRGNAHLALGNKEATLALITLALSSWHQITLSSASALRNSGAERPSCWPDDYLLGFAFFVSAQIIGESAD